jgi:hypothetical protein
MRDLPGTTRKHLLLMPICPGFSGCQAVGIWIVWIKGVIRRIGEMAEAVEIC